MIFLTAIVPTLSTPQGLKPLLTNLIAALPDSSEIVIIDDSGTSANWEENLQLLGILDNYRGIVVRCCMNERNRGPGFSRNVGIAVAQGAYVCFIDDDDTIVVGPFRHLNESAVVGCDVILMGFRDTSGVMTADEVHVPLAGGEIITADRLCERYLESGFIPLQCQAFLFNTNFLRSGVIKFPETYLAEDVAFNVLAILRADRLRLICGPYYVYNSRQGSLKSHSGLERSYDFLLASIYLAESTANLPPLRANLRRETLRRLISLFFVRLCLSKDDPRSTLSPAEIAVEHPWIVHLHQGNEVKEKILARIASFECVNNSDLIKRIVNSLRNKLLSEQACSIPNIFIYSTGPLGIFFAYSVFASIPTCFIDDNSNTVERMRASGFNILEGQKLPSTLQAGDVVVIANIQDWVTYKIMAKLEASCDPAVWGSVSFFTPRELFNGLADLNRYLEVLS